MIDKPYDPAARALELKRRILEIMTPEELAEYVALAAGKNPAAPQQESEK